MDITKLATLARLRLTKEEEKNFSKDFEGILAYVDQIQKADIDLGDLPVLNKGDLVNVMRNDDESNKSGLHSEKLLGLSPKRDGNYVKVKKIL